MRYLFRLLAPAVLLMAFTAPQMPACAAPSSLIYPAAPSAVQVTVLNYHGWAGAYRLSNGLVEAIVVPQIGRIMAFQFVGQPRSNPIYENPKWKSKTVADTTADQWPNFGGDKAWPSPQSDWPQHASRAWPPEQTIDGAPQVAQRLPNGVRLVAASSPSFAMRILRTITLKPGQSRLFIAQHLEKDPDAAGARTGFPLGLWSITQTRPDGTVFLPSAPDAPVLTGIGSLAPGQLQDLAPWVAADSGLLRLRHDPNSSHKIGILHPGGNWLALRYGQNLLFSEHFTFPSSGTLPPGDAPIETYTNPGQASYIEMEMLGPIQPLTRGQTLSYDVFWQLQRLPVDAITPRNEARQVAQAMQNVLADAAK